MSSPATNAVRGGELVSSSATERVALAFLCHPYHRGGVTKWMVDAAAEWRRKNGACWFVAPRPRTPFVSGAGRPTLVELIDALPDSQKPMCARPAVGAEFEFGTVSYRARVYARAILEHVPAGVPIVVSDDAAVWQAASLLSERNPFVGVLHSPDQWYYDLATRHAFSVAALVAVSRRVAREVRAKLDVPRAPITTIPCGIPLPALPDSARTSEELRLIWAGRIEERSKRVTDLPRIAAALDAAGVRFRLDILGDGPDMPILKRMIHAGGLRDCVLLGGWRPPHEVQRRLAQADVLLLPSNFEGMPVVAMEALAVGCSVVGSRSCGLEEYQMHDAARNCLWIHDVGAVDAAARAVEDAARIGSAVRRSCARRLAEDEFAIETCMSRYVDLLADMPAPRPGTRINTHGWRLVALMSWGIAAARRTRVWLAARRAERRFGRPAR